MDGGDTWTKLSQITRGNGFYSIYLSPDPYRTIYVAMHDGAYYQHEFWVYLPLVMK
jgi:hypothetical protein